MTTMQFRFGIAVAVALGAAVRLAYVLTDERILIGGDGFVYHAQANQFADGLHFVSVSGQPIAAHPPGWLTLLGIVSWLGGRSLLAHQLVGVAIGLGVVVVAGLIGRRFYNGRVGVIAAVIAALYPGFWLLEAQVLSEPLGLLLLGLLILAVFDLAERPTLRRCALAGALCGLLAMVRSEQIALLAIVLVPVIIAAKSVSWRERATRLAALALACGVVLLPWTIYNFGRFEEPVFLAANTGGTLLAGNCPPATFDGNLVGFYDITCNQRMGFELPRLDQSQRDRVARERALHNVGDHLGKLPVLVAARFGRLLAVYRPTQTVRLVADWMTTGTTPIWAWVGSFWVLVPLAAIGTVSARRTGRLLLPLLGPLILVVVLTALVYGEPRYHTPADLGIVVLAATGVDRLLTRRSRPAPIAGSVQESIGGPVGSAPPSPPPTPAG